MGIDFFTVCVVEAFQVDQPLSKSRIKVLGVRSAFLSFLSIQRLYKLFYPPIACLKHVVLTMAFVIKEYKFKARQPKKK